LRWPFVVTSLSSLCRLCAMCDLDACPSPPPGAAAGHPATRNIPTTPAAAGTSHRGFGGFHLASQSLSPRNPLHIPPPASAAPPPPLRSPTCMCSLMHPSLQPWVGDLGPCVCLSMRVFASFGSLLPSFLTPLVPRIPNSLVIRRSHLRTPLAHRCVPLLCVLCAGAPAPAPGPPGAPGTACCPCLWDGCDLGCCLDLQSLLPVCPVVVGVECSRCTPASWSPRRRRCRRCVLAVLARPPPNAECGPCGVAFPPPSFFL